MGLDDATEKAGEQERDFHLQEEKGQLKVSCQGHSMTFQQNSFRIFRILQLFYRNDHYNETMCRVQHLGCYLEGQGHSMILQLNRIWPQTFVFFKSDLTTTFEKLLLCVQYLFMEHYPNSTGSCFFLFLTLSYIFKTHLPFTLTLLNLIFC